MIFRVLSIICVASVLGVVPALAQQAPPQEPILRIDPGMHTAEIPRIGVDAACTLLATASQDKSVRLWRLLDGKLLNTLRPPTGPGEDGQVYAVAVAPDASWAAAGGWTTGGEPTGDWAVYIFETTGGTLYRRLGGLSHRVIHLAVSADGRYLAAVLKYGHGLRVWDTQSWRLIADDKNYGGEDAYGAAFDRKGVLYTVAYDGKLRRYAPPYQAKPTSVPTRGSKQPSSVAVHPSGNRVAVGYDDTTAVEVYDAAKLAWRFAADTKGVNNGNLGSVAWSSDGKRLYAGGTFAIGETSPIRVWERAGQGPFHDLVGPKDTIFHVLPCGNGMAFGAADPAFGLFASDGSRRLWREGVQADLRVRRGKDFSVAADGRRVRFGLEGVGVSPVLFDLATEQLSDAPNQPSDLAEADTMSLPVTDWFSTFNPKLGGVPILLESLEMSSSLAVAPDKERFILGTHWLLRSYDKDGKELWQKPVPAVVWSVNIPRDGGLAVAAYGDGTIRWHRLRDGQELLALFVHKVDRRWVAWTPKGYFTASAGGEELVGWHVNRGLDQAADFFPVSKFRDQFYRPDIIARVLTDLDEEKAIVEANRIANKASENEDIRKRQPPVLRIISPADGSSVATDEVMIEYSLRSPSGLPIKRVFAQIDGNPVKGQTAAVPAVGASGEVQGILKVKLPRRNVTVSVTAETDQAHDTQAVRLVRSSAVIDPDPLPNLYAVVIGVANYANLRQLPFADDDALAVADVLASQKGATYADVKVKLLTTRKNREGNYEEAEATHANILERLDWLREKRKDADGTILVYFSGHGQTSSAGESYLFPVDFDANKYFRTALSRAHFLEGLTKQGRAFIFVDACHAAGGLADIQARPLKSDAFVNEVAASGSWVFAFASSLANQPAYGTAESKSFFTKALVQGLRGAAAPGKKVILTGHLDIYLFESVKDQSGGEQVAVMFKSPSAVLHVPVAIFP